MVAMMSMNVQKKNHVKTIVKIGMLQVAEPLSLKLGFVISSLISVLLIPELTGNPWKPRY